MDISQQRTVGVAPVCTLLDLASEASALSTLALIFKPSSSWSDGGLARTHTTDTLHPNLR